MAVLLTGVATLPTAAWAEKKTAERRDAASIEYHLPVTSAKLNLDLTLKSCGVTPVATAAVTILPTANPNPSADQRFRLYGADLESFTKKREVSIEIYPNGAIKSFNGGASDRTGAIITSAIKSIGGLVMLLADPGAATAPLTGTCTDETAAALRQADIIAARIAVLRGELPTASPERAPEIGESINALASELARLRAGPLNVKLQREIAFHKGSTGAVVAWKKGELAKWFGDSAPETVLTNFRVGYCIRTVETARLAQSPSCTAELARSGQAFEQDAQTRPPASETPSCAPTKCRKTIVFREPVEARMAVVSAGTDFAGVKMDEQLGTGDFPLAQWGIISELPLSAAFGSSRSMALGMNEFGKRTSFTWKSDARGETIMGGAASAVEAGAGLVGAFETDLEELQAEALQLETEQKVHLLRKCKEILAAGGTCPA